MGLDPMSDSHQHERRFHGEPGRLRSAERVAHLEVERVVALSLEGLAVRSVLDIGTGTGLFAEAFLKGVPAVMGIDTNLQLLTLARQGFPEAQFLASEAEHLPFPDHSFDLAFLGLLLHETDDPLEAIQEARRIARSRVVVLEWPFQEEEHGPPLADRLRPEAIEGLIGKATYRSMERFHLVHVDLYRLRP